MIMLGCTPQEECMPQSDWIEVDRDTGGVATVTITNTAKLNTLNRAVMTALIDAVEGLATDAALRVVVLRGAGERAFIGGADITEMAGLDAASARDFIILVHRSCDVFRRLPVPVIARIQGFVLGAGLEVAAACDMRVASSDARFGMPEVRIGIPSVVEAALLPQLIGWGRTRELLLTGEVIDAPTAERWGLVEEVVAAEALDAAVERRVAAILACGPQAVRAQKALITTWESLPLRDAIAQGIDSFAASWNSDEPAQMMGEFLEARRRRKLAASHKQDAT
jgi:enoyl-CoA hydratase/carnithine racemase